MQPLKRDYQQNPLKKLKANTPTGYAYEKPFKEDLEELYIIRNKSQPELCRYFGVTRRILQGWIKVFGLKKDSAKRLENSTSTIQNKTSEQYEESARKARETKLKRYGKLKKLLRYETDRASKNFFKKVLDKRNEV